MIKLLILGGVIFIIYILFFKKPKQHKEELTMLECDKCGTFISDKEAIKKSDKKFCSSECAT